MDHINIIWWRELLFAVVSLVVAVTVFLWFCWRTYKTEEGLNEFALKILEGKKLTLFELRTALKQHGVSVSESGLRAYLDRQKRNFKVTSSFGPERDYKVTYRLMDRIEIRFGDLPERGRFQPWMSKRLFMGVKVSADHAVILADHSGNLADDAGAFINYDPGTKVVMLL